MKKQPPKHIISHLFFPDFQILKIVWFHFISSQILMHGISLRSSRSKSGHVILSLLPRAPHLVQAQPHLQRAPSCSHTRPSVRPSLQNRSRTCSFSVLPTPVLTHTLGLFFSFLLKAIPFIALENVASGTFTTRGQESAGSSLWAPTRPLDLSSSFSTFDSPSCLPW